MIYLLFFALFILCYSYPMTPLPDKDLGWRTFQIQLVEQLNNETDPEARRSLAELLEKVEEKVRQLSSRKEKEGFPDIRMLHHGAASNEMLFLIQKKSEKKRYCCFPFCN